MFISFFILVSSFSNLLFQIFSFLFRATSLPLTTVPVSLYQGRSASKLFDRLLLRPEIYVTVRPTAELLVIINVRVHKKGNIIKSARTKQACGLIGPHHHRISSIVIVIVTVPVTVISISMNLISTRTTSASTMVIIIIIGLFLFLFIPSLQAFAIVITIVKIQSRHVRLSTN